MEKIVIDVLMCFLTALLAMALAECFGCRWLRRYRVVEIQDPYEDETHYEVQRSFLYVFWFTLEYAVSPYLELPYKFETVEKAKKFIDEKLKEENPKIKVVFTT